MFICVNVRLRKVRVWGPMRKGVKSVMDEQLLNKRVVRFGISLMGDMLDTLVDERSR